MPEKIGKYQVLERIGRGGMGTIFKAHDPVLNRSVALKVISTEIEVTDDLRARFFREAQAAARLSHPNIVTIYDMGEDDGRLFIVMELLEGEELRRLIAQRTALALEDKLSVMVQVCDGLHYAHQKGVVHRDVKPGNIMRLHNGQVKILDFGIAQIANTEGGLTRTGLIMGTLRYISPEQVLGQADQRSDIFSVGAVFYELLSLRPPFGGENPMQLLDQLRTEEPPLLNLVDPTIPPELAVIVERAIRKDPAARFADLEEMRLELEQVQRHLAEEVKRLRVQVRGQRDQLLQLQAALVERAGPAAGEEAIPVVDDRWRLATMQALEIDFTKKVETLEARLARADLVGPAVQRGNELMAAGQFADAAAEFEAVVADMPEHARALEGLKQVRAQLEVQRRHQLAAKLIDDARAALEEGGPALCLEILKQAAGIPAPAETVPEIASLRQAAEDRLGQEAARRAREQAERAREQMTQARDTAQAQAAARHAPALWTEAEERSARADAAFAREAYTEAARDFEGALGSYRRFEEAARQAQLHEKNAAERALAQAMEAQEGARAADAMHYARDRWDAAEAKFAEARAVFDMPKVVGRGAAIFHEAVALYRGAEEAARTARRRERQEAEEAQDRARQGQRSAAVTDAEHLAETLWNEAAARSAGAEAAFAREQYRKAAEGFVAALALYRQAEEQAREARRRQRERAEHGRPAAADRRRLALAADAATHAAPEMSEAEARVAEAETAFAREAWVEAGQAFDDAVALYRRAEERAREVLRALEIARADAAKACETVAFARRGAAAANSSKYAGKQWLAGESLEAQANAALDRREYTGARSLFIEARRQYATAAQSAAVAQEAEARRADAMVGDARRLLASGDIAGCLRRLDEVLTLRPGHAAAEELRLGAQDMLSQAKADADRTLIGLGPTAPPADETRVLRTGLAEPAPLTDASSEAPTVLSEPPTVLAEPPTVLAELPTALAEPPTVLAEPPTVLAEPPTVFADGREGRSGTPPVRPPSESPDATRVVAEASDDAAAIGVTPRHDPPSRIPAPRRGVTASTPRQRAAGPPTGRSRWSRRPGALAAVGGALAAIAVAVFYWSVPSTAPPPRPPASSTASPVRPPAPTPAPIPVPPPAISPPPNAALPPPTEKPRDDAMAAREAALLAEAERLAKTQLAAGKEGAARAAESRATEARRAAELVEAPKMASPLWAKARAAQGKADEALKGQAFDRAQALFGDAEKAYREAEKATTASGARRRDLEEVEQARAVASQARRDAEVAAAPQWASKVFASAQQKEGEAEGLLKRQDSATAKLRFQEAQQAYRQAVLEAQQATRQAALDAERAVASAQRQRSEVEEARGFVASARRGAEQARAAQYAPRRLAAAQAKEGDANAALGRSDYAQAKRLFGEAQADYQGAAQEAKRQAEAEHLVALVDQSRSRALARKDEALKAEADRLTKDAFDAGQAKLTDGDGLAGQQNHAAATQAYKDAADRYMEAGRRAKVLQEARSLADQARTRMTSEKQRARPDAPEFNAALSQERQGTQHYQHASFKEADESFTAATELFARAAARPPERPRPPAPADEVRGVLDSYVRSFETKDMALMQKIRPGLKPAEARRMRESFDQSKVYRLSLRVDSLDVSGDEAVVKGRREDNLTSKDGQSFRHESSFTFRLKRTGEGWIIDAVN